MIEKVTIYNPSNEGGGTIILFAMLAESFIKQNIYKVEIVDFENGYTVNYLKSKNLDFKLIVYADIIKLDEKTNFIINSLSGKLIGKKFFLTKDSKINLFTTFIFDFYKYIPFYNLFYKSKISWKRFGIQCIQPFKYKKMQNFINKIDKEHGVVYMDLETKNTTEEIFKLNLLGSVIPIFTSVSKRKKIWDRNDKTNSTLNLFWVGRLADFKSKTVCSIATSISSLNEPENVVFHIIGNGPQYDFVKSYIENLGNVKAEYYGYMDLKDMDALLIEKADLFLGHGLSIVQGARLGIPCILVDGMYKMTDPNFFKCDWLYNQKNSSVGKISYKNEDFEGDKTLVSFLNNLNKSDLKFLGDKTYTYWEENHSANSIVEKYSQEMKANTFTYEDFIRSEVGETNTLLIKIRELLKPIYYYMHGIRK